MKTPFQQLLSVWLAIVLAAAPLPVFSALQTGNGEAHCMTMNASQHAEHGSMTNAAHGHRHSEAPQTQASCKHCDDNRCESGACADQGCSPCHAANLIMAPVFLAALIRYSEVRPLGAASNLVSLTYPPLLHPPSALHTL
ncbi:MAG: hypothetical protein J5I92_10980 [Thiogranum sp.]|nr:hypothetical protein [Thiogranum sp.]